KRLADAPIGMMVDINAGDLLLTRGVLSKIRQQIQRANAAIGIMYSTVPQTQQASLDEGLFVKEKLSAGWTPIRQQLPLKKAAPASSPPASKISSQKSASSSVGGVKLPEFSPL